MKFTFKCRKPAGRYCSFEATNYDIKLKRKICGQFAKHFNNPITINLMVKKETRFDDGNPNCDWMWISLKRKFATVEEAKQFLVENTDSIINQFNIHFID